MLGLSVDSVFSHQAFAKELGDLPFPLLADFHPKGEVCRAYGVWREDRGYAKRALFIIDRAGLIQHAEAFPTGMPDVAQVLEKVRGL